MKVIIGEGINIEVTEATGTDLDNIINAGGKINAESLKPIASSSGPKITFNAKVYVQIGDKAQTTAVFRALGVIE